MTKASIESLRLFFFCVFKFTYYTQKKTKYLIKVVVNLNERSVCVK